MSFRICFRFVSDLFRIRFGFVSDRLFRIRFGFVSFFFPIEKNKKMFRIRFGFVSDSFRICFGFVSDSFYRFVFSKKIKNKKNGTGSIFYFGEYLYDSFCNR